MSLKIEDITYTYLKKTPFARRALNNVSLEIKRGEFVAIAGHTGSGKSTLVQHLNGLLHPDSGRVLVDGEDLAGHGDKARQARHKVGMVFQYPEHQLFEETVAEDIAFGPLNMGLPAEETEKRVREAMAFVQLPYETFSRQSPFHLSGGQKRRAAIAGIIAMHPEYLVLDEPAAGLDPRAHDALMHKISLLHKNKQTTVILVTHNMDDAALLADRIIFLCRGQVLLDDSPQEAFRQEDKIAQAGLEVPQMMALLRRLRDGGLELDSDTFSVEEGVSRVLAALGRQDHAE